MLGEVPGFFPAGEVGYLWRRALAENRQCGCGARFLECPFWRRVGDEAYGGWDKLDFAAISKMESRVARHRFLPFLIFPRLSPRYAHDLRRYGDLLSRLYAAIRETSGTSILVDSTTAPYYGFVLRRVPGLELKVAHLIRDSRGTAFSWTRRVRRVDVEETDSYLRTYPPASTALRWVVYHLLVRLLARLIGDDIIIRYEDVVDSPLREICRIIEHVDGPPDPRNLAFVSDGSVRLRGNHIATGNRMRFARGEIHLRRDDEWKSKMTTRQKYVVTLLTAPLLRGFGYRTSRRDVGRPSAG
jgi:hypothetical protein